jgi:2-polyprenyl-3-methyl-5-hydroxy-6-metoxy-1,4-benzoquinol methylase
MTPLACRGCGAAGLEIVLDLGEMPLANALLTEAELPLSEPRYPLALAFCSRCLLVQITHTVEPAKLFREYAYFSSVSDEMVAHAGQIAARMRAQLNLDERSLVIELASNDGYLLQHYLDEGIPVLGVDPARNIAESAAARGIPTLAEFFNADVANTLRQSGRVADVVHANNVIAHVPDIHGFIAGIATILKPEGLAVIETPYVRDLVDRMEFDTIYHEHIFYYSLSSISRLLANHGLTVVDVERIAIHGGSLRVFVARDEGAAPMAAVSRLLDEEAAAGLTKIEYFNEFATRVEALGSSLRALLAGLKQDGKSIAGYGAAAKGTVLLNAFRIGAETLDFVADRSPHKQGRYMPGVHIPVVPAERLAEALPDACLLLVWNFANEVIAQQAEYVRRGGRFVIPAPVPRIVPTGPAVAPAEGTR